MLLSRLLSQKGSKIEEYLLVNLSNENTDDTKDVHIEAEEVKRITATIDSFRFKEKLTVRPRTVLAHIRSDQVRYEKGQVNSAQLTSGQVISETSESEPRAQFSQGPWDREHVSPFPQASLFINSIHHHSSGALTRFLLNPSTPPLVFVVGNSTNPFYSNGEGSVYPRSRMDLI